MYPRRSVLRRNLGEEIHISLQNTVKEMRQQMVGAFFVSEAVQSECWRELNSQGLHAT